MEIERLSGQARQAYAASLSSSAAASTNTGTVYCIKAIYGKDGEIVDIIDPNSEVFVRWFRINTGMRTVVLPNFVSKCTEGRLQFDQREVLVQSGSGEYRRELREQLQSVPTGEEYPEHVCSCVLERPAGALLGDENIQTHLIRKPGRVARCRIPLLPEQDLKISDYQNIVQNGDQMKSNDEEIEQAVSDVHVRTALAALEKVPVVGAASSVVRARIEAQGEAAVARAISEQIRDTHSVSVDVLSQVLNVASLISEQNDRLDDVRSEIATFALLLNDRAFPTADSSDDIFSGPSVESLGWLDVERPYSEKTLSMHLTTMFEGRASEFDVACVEHDVMSNGDTLPLRVSSAIKSIRGKYTQKLPFFRHLYQLAGDSEVLRLVVTFLESK